MATMKATSKVTGRAGRSVPRYLIAKPKTSERCFVPRLVGDLAIERYTHGAQEKTGVLVRLGGGVKGDVATRNHLRRVPEYLLEKRITK